MWLAKLWGMLKKGGERGNEGGEGEEELVEKLVEIVEDEEVPQFTIPAPSLSISLSFAPSKNRKVMRFVQSLEKEEGMNEEMLDCAAQILLKFPRKVEIKKNESEETKERKDEKEEEDKEEEEKEEDKEEEDKEEEEKEEGEKEEEEKGEVFLYAVWVDPRDLSFHNFECILPLDRILHVPEREEGGGRKEKKSSKMLNLRLEDFRQVKENVKVYVGKVKGEDVRLLKKLDELGLYQKPANSETRGGERFVFSSSILSNTLTFALRESTILKIAKMNNKRKKVKFVGVNSVFRCNKFFPGDKKFQWHMDTPYYDPSLSHISKFSLLLYLSSGIGSPALRFSCGNEGEVEIEKIDEMDCVIFDQEYSHEGNAFLDSNKIFLRSELIFKQEYFLEHIPEISSLFSSATYFTLQSTFQPELAKYAHELYEKVNRAHWGIEEKEGKEEKETKRKAEEIVLHKCWEQKVHFVTNGNDYYFPFFHGGRGKVEEGERGNVEEGGDKEEDEKEKDVPLVALKTFALIAVLDYFNCNIEKKEAKKKEEDEKEGGPSESISKEKTGEKQEHINKEGGEGQADTKEKEEQKNKPEPIMSPFRKLCETSVITPDSENIPEWAIEYLWGKITKKEEREANSQTAGILPISQKEKEEWFNNKVNEVSKVEEGPETKEKFRRNCCATHNKGIFDAKYSNEVFCHFSDAADFARMRLIRSPLLFFNHQLRIDLDHVEVKDDKIYINYPSSSSSSPSSSLSFRPQPINFASCWNYCPPPSAFVGVSEKISAPLLLLPPISFYPIMPSSSKSEQKGEKVSKREEEEEKLGICFRIDFFHNDWAKPKVDLEKQIFVPDFRTEKDAYACPSSQVFASDDEDSEYEDDEEEEEEEEKKEKESYKWEADDSGDENDGPYMGLFD